MSALNRSDMERGVREHQTRFFVSCVVCAREERRGALPSMLDVQPERSPAAKRLRATCKGGDGATLTPCRFTHQARVVALDHADALRCGLVEPAPILRLRGDDDEAMFAVRLDRRPVIDEIAALGEIARKSFLALADEEAV